jgi:hypothetical protein
MASKNVLFFRSETKTRHLGTPFAIFHPTFSVAGQTPIRRLRGGGYEAAPEQIDVASSSGRPRAFPFHFPPLQGRLQQ